MGGPGSGRRPWLSEDIKREHKRERRRRWEHSQMLSRHQRRRAKLNEQAPGWLTACREARRRGEPKPERPPENSWALIAPAASLRSGFLTSAAARGASIFKMADQSRHKSMDTLRGYVRDAEIFKDHAGSGLL
jgi:hypothetical protein